MVQFEATKKALSQKGKPGGKDSGNSGSHQRDSLRDAAESREMDLDDDPTGGKGGGRRPKRRAYR